MNAAVSKTVVRVSVPGVRIPPSPPLIDCICVVANNSACSLSKTVRLRCPAPSSYNQSMAETVFSVCDVIKRLANFQVNKIKQEDN